MELLNKVLSKLNSEAPGSGIDPYDSVFRDHPMAYALLLRASVLTGNILEVVDLANKLLEIAISTSRVYGWGLGFEWNPFSKEFNNPATTVYGITQAIVVEALIDAYEVTGDERYLRASIQALDYYSTSFTRDSDGGFFWYSDQFSDSINVHNVSIMLAAQYARAANITKSQKFLDIAMLAIERFNSCKASKLTFDYWNYSVRNDRPNDLVHASYVAYGASNASKYAGLFTNCEQEYIYYLQEHCFYLQTFLQNGIVNEFSPIHFLHQNLRNKRARLWALGMAIYVFAEARERSICDLLIAATDDYIDITGNFITDINDLEIKNTNEPRHLAHLILGLAKYNSVFEHISN